VLPPGHRLGKYELIDRIAVGGMAEIYLARVRGVEGFQKLDKAPPSARDVLDALGRSVKNQGRGYAADISGGEIHEHPLARTPESARRRARGDQDELSSLLQFGNHFAFDDEHDVPSLTPMIRYVSRGVLHHPNAHVARLNRSPK
jgi:hypothetical protein